MENVIKCNFGKEDREHARRLTKLLKIVSDQEENILADPGKYLALASDRLADHEQFFWSLLDAVRLPWSVNILEAFSNEPHQMEPPDIVRVDRRDYEVLQALKKLIRDRHNRS